MDIRVDRWDDLSRCHSMSRTVVDVTHDEVLGEFFVRRQLLFGVLWQFLKFLIIKSK